MASSADPWTTEYGEASKLADDITNMIPERSSFGTRPGQQRYFLYKLYVYKSCYFNISIIEQDEGLEKLEEIVISTKHIALAVNEELDLHTRLIDDLDEHVEVTDSRLKRVQKNLAILNKRTKGGCSCLCMLLSVIGIVVLVVALWLIIKYIAYMLVS
ncbi:putative target SNARE coiled-coil domain-containing protein [Helianthus anomalus]